MTFYEAALRVLEAAGRPLHFQEITERSVQQNLLSHVGKTPELTMLSRLLAMARRKTDRKVVVTSKDTFALADWALPEEADALSQTALAETREEENLPPLRPAERHPEPRADYVRVAGRGTERKRRRDEEDGRKRKRKFPPISEVVFEILSDVGVPLTSSAIAEVARQRELAGDELSEQEILTALLEDNQRRIDAGRRPQFVLDRQSGALSLERAEAPSEVPPLELQAAFASALGIPLEGGRPLLPRPAAAARETSAELAQAHAALKSAARAARRATARALRRRLMELDAGTFEKTMVKVLHATGFRELKVARRSKDGPLLIARTRDASLELRYAIRLLPGSTIVDRKVVQELRRDLGHQAAQVGLIASPGDLRGEARSEALGPGALVFLWCGEALADKYLESEAGVAVTRVESYEIEEHFFEAARLDAEEAQRRREERLREKRRGEERAEDGEARDEAPAGDGASRARGDEPEERFQAEAALEPPLPDDAERAGASSGELDADDDEDEGDEPLEEGEPLAAAGRSAAEGVAGPGQPGQAANERRRRRRRRRGRRGRGRAPESGASSTEGGAVPSAASSGVPEPSPEPPPPPASGGAGEGSAA
ncbi:MAG TPA: HTH domain-containing protein [Myxococcaceae bacterium]|nr:HTH domain-containing protein [Myxococcaceae bacterium]